MEIFEQCPECGSDDLGDFWKPERKLQQHCYSCGWEGPVRIPEVKDISIKKTVPTGQFNGYEFYVYDKYGHTLAISRSYDSEKEALAGLQKRLLQGQNDKIAGPYVGVLWPAHIEVTGQRFEIVNGKFTLI